MTSRSPYLRVQVGGLTVTIRDRRAWLQVGKALITAAPLVVLLAGSALSWFAGFPWR